MKIHYDVDINFFFKVHNSPMYGGEGTVGYCATSFHHCKSVSDEKIESAYEKIADTMAANLHVDVSDLESITREEYDASDEDE